MMKSIPKANCLLTGPLNWRRMGTLRAGLWWRSLLLLRLLLVGNPRPVERDSVELRKMYK